VIESSTKCCDLMLNSDQEKKKQSLDLLKIQIEELNLKIMQQLQKVVEALAVGCI
jgi:hypothetical protein